ncbi:MAG: hypothetical protein GY915_08925 [bacterium]|nr:hypothetical protein [bacterium]
MIKKHKLMAAILSIAFFNSSFLQASDSEESKENIHLLSSNYAEDLIGDLTKDFVSAVCAAQEGTYEILEELSAHQYNIESYITGNFFKSIRKKQKEQAQETDINPRRFKNVTGPNSLRKFVGSKLKKKSSTLTEWDCLDDNAKDLLEGFFLNYLTLAHERAIEEKKVKFIWKACDNGTFPCFSDWAPSDELQSAYSEVMKATHEERANNVGFY